MRVDADDHARPSTCGMAECEEPREICMEEGAIEKLEEEMSEGFLKGYISPLLICDTDAYGFTEDVMEEIYDRSQNLILDAENLQADVHTMEIVENYMEDDIDLILAVGDETIQDISRCVAQEYKIPFVAVPAVRGADGFASMTAYLAPENLRKQRPVPLCIYGDSRIFSREPLESENRKKY